MVWSELVGGLLGDWQIFGARVSADGSFVQPLGQITATTTGHSSVRPDVTWNGSRYLVVWQYNYADTDVDIRGQRAAANGALIESVFNISDPPGYQTEAAVTAAGATFYVVWDDNRAGNYDIYGGRVSSGGSPLDGQGKVVADDLHNERRPDVAWNGSNFLVVFDFDFSTTDTDVHARPVNSAGVAIGSRQTISNTGADEENPAIGSQGTEFLVAWEDSRNQATTEADDIYGARLAALGTITTGAIPISRAAGDQHDPAIAYNGTYLVAWDDRRNNRYDIYANRVKANGAVQDGNGFVVDTTGQPITPDVTRGPGTKWAVDSETTNSIVHRTIAPK